ncbi:MAG: MBL fold metallo-hydrolase [Ignavibacteria bacterium]|nr:MBL fold metallo-hydrolase [Ignavibacteria bacterium]MBP6510866.1 MBL fold metallo-hydrolase [Candidatus Kapabacteria bacterium]MBK6760308.1 MBL fold metallo-hydrolase [Ignavibacteria bacterium]MBK7033950.1 MBL fold metallo-hydrolase [Ignavibacteria bacterium]MBK7185229.1 MBL fold metallo-hydrolase [Ignavibacteria bacterium]
MTRFTVLGSGTSTGVPSVACECPTCTSEDPRDQRLRTSLLVQSDSTTIVVDTSLDFRQQMLRHNVLDINAVIFTHHHFDHIGGFDDVRPYNFRSGRPLPVYAMEETVDVLRSTFPYAFGLVESTGASTPSVDIHLIDNEPFSIGDIDVIPIPMRHGRSMRVNGYRFGNIAYCTDTNFLPSASLDLLRGLDTLVIDGLRWEDHPTHFTVDQAIAIINELEPKQAYLTHIAHQINHKRDSPKLPSNVHFAFDGLTLNVG